MNNNNSQQQVNSSATHSQLKDQLRDGFQEGKTMKEEVGYIDDSLVVGETCGSIEEV